MRVPKAVHSQDANTPVRVLIQSRTGDAFAYWKAEWVAFDVLLPLAKESLQGGLAAHNEIGRQLLQALQPYRKAGMPDRQPHQCFTLLRCSLEGARILYLRSVAACICICALEGLPFNISHTHVLGDLKASKALGKVLAQQITCAELECSSNC